MKKKLILNFEFNTCMAQHDLSVSLFFCNYTFHAFSLCVSLFEKKIATMVTIFFFVTTRLLVIGTLCFL